MLLVKKFNLDISNNDYDPKFEIKAFDNCIFNITISDNGYPIDLKDQTIKLYIVKPDKTLLYQEDDISVENNIITIKVHNQAFTSVGCVYGEIELNDNSGIATTHSFIYKVIYKIGNGDSIPSHDEVSELKKIQELIKESQDQLNKFKDDLKDLLDLVANKDQLIEQNELAKGNIEEIKKDIDKANEVINSIGGVIGIENLKKDVENIKNDIFKENISESILNENINFKVGTGKVNGVDKDYSETMKNSLVELNNIRGKTFKSPKGNLYSVNLSSASYFEDPIDILSKPVYDNFQCNYKLENNILSVTSIDNAWGYVQFEIEVDSYCDYLLKFDFNEISGNAWVAVATSPEVGKPEFEICNIKYDDNFKDAIFNSKNTTKLYIKFYSNVFVSVKDITVDYSNVKLIKCKDYHKDQILLRDLPNGIADEYINGKYIKRIERFYLNGFEDWDLVDQTKPNTNEFLCKLPNTVNVVDKLKICVNSNKYKCMSDDQIYVKDEVGFAVGGGAGQLAFRVGKGIDSVEKLKDHLQNNETDIYVELQIYDQIINTDISILCDKGDSICISSPLSFNNSHEVQLNTNSQIKEIQQNNQTFKINIFEKLKDMFDIKFSLTEHGFIKFPTILGGFLIQWGRVNIELKNSWSYVGNFNLPITFNNILNVHGSVCDCNFDDPVHGKVAIRRNTSDKISKLEFSVIDDRMTDKNGIYAFDWIAIGK